MTKYIYKTDFFIINVLDNCIPDNVSFIYSKLKYKDTINNLEHITNKDDKKAFAHLSNH
jgi:hypothetical protein